MSRLTNDGTGSCTFDELSSIIACGTKKYTYEEANTVGKNQMRLASFYNGVTYAYSYDKEGNPTAITNKFTSLTYDEFNRLRQLVRSGVTDKYWYNQAGLRFKREQDSLGANTETIYTMYSGNLILFQERYNDAGVWQEARLNLILVGQILGHVRKVTGQAEVYQFFGLDHLGSRRVVWNADGTKQVKFSYDAWGVKTRSGGTSSDDYLASYTGKEYDTSALIYFNARYYDPTLGRFLSEDPSRKGHSWYSYCENNPLTFTDPMGRDVGNPGFSGYNSNSSASAPSQHQEPAFERPGPRDAGASALPPTTSSLGIDFIKGYELLRTRVYTDPAGYPTIGYGHRVLPGETFPHRITSEEANQLMARDLYPAERAVRSSVTAPITQSQFDALVSLGYNIGGPRLARSEVVRMINSGDISGLEAEWTSWNRAGGQVLPGLVSRRTAEWNMFSAGIYDAAH